MPQFVSDGVSIAYAVYGGGPPVLLIHGFASSAQINWGATGWVETLTAAGYQAIAIDNRGHGQSEKFYDAERYWAHLLADDAVRLLDHLGSAQAAVIGYSMGARIAAFLALRHPHRVSCAILGGMGLNLVHGLADADAIIAGLEAATLEELTHKSARQFRIFADQSNADRKALAACMVTSREPMAAGDVRKIEAPVLVAVGELDEMAGRPEALAELLPRGEAVVIPRRNHMLATGDARFKAAALAFLARHAPPIRQM